MKAAIVSMCQSIPANDTSLRIHEGYQLHYHSLQMANNIPLASFRMSFISFLLLLLFTEMLS